MAAGSMDRVQRLNVDLFHTPVVGNKTGNAGVQEDGRSLFGLFSGIHNTTLDPQWQAPPRMS